MKWCGFIYSAALNRIRVLNGAGLIGVMATLIFLDGTENGTVVRNKSCGNICGYILVKIELIKLLLKNNF